MFFPHVSTKNYSSWKDEAPENDLYLFNTRRENYGHVGFIKIDNGNWRTFQYSRMTSNGIVLWDGYFAGYFEEWFFRSRYRDSQIELYKVLMPPTPPTNVHIVEG